MKVIVMTFEASITDIFSDRKIQKSYIAYGS